MKLIALLLASASVSLLSACVGERSLEETAVFVSAKMSDASAVNVKNLPAVLASEQASRRILLLDSSKDWNSPDAVLWSWDPSKADGMPAKYAEWFGNPSDAKPVLGATHVLVAASKGGVALVRVRDSRVVRFMYAGGNVHSACMLPDGNIAVASSDGNMLTVFAAKNAAEGVPCASKKTYPLEFAHGVVWDASQKILWALGKKTLEAYKYNFDSDSPELEKTAEYPLPEKAVVGHDLYPLPSSKIMFITGHKGVVLFDSVSRKFADVCGVGRIKSVSLSSPDGEIISLIPEVKWWSASVSFGASKTRRVGTLDGGRIYKARWFLPDGFSEK